MPFLQHFYLLNPIHSHIHSPSLRFDILQNIWSMNLKSSENVFISSYNERVLFILPFLSPVNERRRFKNLRIHFNSPSQMDLIMYLDDKPELLLKQ